MRYDLIIIAAMTIAVIGLFLFGLYEAAQEDSPYDWQTEGI